MASLAPLVIDFSPCRKLNAWAIKPCKNGAATEQSRVGPLSGGFCQSLRLSSQVLASSPRPAGCVCPPSPLRREPLTGRVRIAKTLRRFACSSTSTHRLPKDRAKNLRAPVHRLYVAVARVCPAPGTELPWATAVPFSLVVALLIVGLGAR